MVIKLKRRVLFTCLACLACWACLALLAERPSAAMLPLNILADLGQPGAIPGAKPFVMLANTDPFYARGWVTTVIKDIRSYDAITMQVTVHPRLPTSKDGLPVTYHAHVYLFGGATESRAIASGARSMTSDAVWPPGRPVNDWAIHQTEEVTGDFLLNDVAGFYVFAEGAPQPMSKLFLTKGDGTDPPETAVTEIDPKPTYTAGFHGATYRAALRAKHAELNYMQEAIPKGFQPDGFKGPFFDSSGTGTAFILSHGHLQYQPVAPQQLQITSPGVNASGISVHQSHFLSQAPHRHPLTDLRQGVAPGQRLKISLRAADFQGWDWMRVAIALYATDPAVRTDPSTGASYKADAVLNMYPTDRSYYQHDPLISAEEQEYPNDPFIVAAPWMKSGRNPTWLSLYGYLIKPLTREPMFKLLSAKGPRLPTEAEYAELSALFDGLGGPIWAALESNPETNFHDVYYGNVLLDWADRLGEESCLWGLGWASSVFQLEEADPTSTKDSYMNTRGLLPSHIFLAKWLSMVYQWQLQSSVYFPLPEGWKPKRFPASFGHWDYHIGNGWDWIDSNKFLMPVGSSYLEGWPHLTFPEGRTMMVAGSSLGIPFEGSTPMEYAWQPSLPPCFGQWRVFSGPEIYQATLYPYLPSTAGVWLFIHSIPGIPPGIFNTGGPLTARTWWPWYQTLPWSGWWDEHTFLSIDQGLSLFLEILDDYYESLTPQAFPKFSQVQRFANPQFWFTTAYYPIQNIQVLVRKK